VESECDSLSNLATKMVAGGEEPSNPSLLLSPVENNHLVGTIPIVNVVSTCCDTSVCINNIAQTPLQLLCRVPPALLRLVLL